MSVAATSNRHQRELTTYQAPYSAPLLASLILLLTLLQGTSFTLTLAMRSPLASTTMISLVTVLWLAMYLVASSALLAVHGLNWLTWLVRYRLALTLLLAGTMLSSIWSLDPNLTLERSIHLLGSTLLAVYLGFSLPLRYILRASALTLGLLMLASVVSVWLLPAFGLQDYEGQLVWAGVMVSKNTLGFWSAITLLLLITLSCQNIPSAQRLLYLALSAAALLCLYKSVSATSILALISAALIMLYLHAAFSLRLGMLPMVVIGVLCASLAGMAFYYIDTAELIGRSGDLTGRGEVWEQTWQLIVQRPLTGYGYGTIWYPTSESLWIQQALTDFSWTVYHAHNGLLQIASEIGLPLTALALFMILQQLAELFYCQYQKQQPGVLFVVGFTVALLVSNYSEARLLINRELYWIFFIALPISMLQQVTLSARHPGYGYGFNLAAFRNHGVRTHRSSTPFELPANIHEKLTRTRGASSQHRALKQRMSPQQQTPAASRNVYDNDASVGYRQPLTDRLGQRLFAPHSCVSEHDRPDFQASTQTDFTAHPEQGASRQGASRGAEVQNRKDRQHDGQNNRDSHVALKRHVARRQSKAG